MYYRIIDLRNEQARYKSATTFCGSKINTKAKRRFATHSELTTVQTKDPEKIFENMERYVIDTFGITTIVVNQTFVRESRIETSSSHSV